MAVDRFRLKGGCDEVPSIKGMILIIKVVDIVREWIVVRLGLWGCGGAIFFCINEVLDFMAEVDALVGEMEMTFVEGTILVDVVV